MSLVPRRVHLIWVQGAPPPRFQPCLDAWRRVAPDYKLKVWSGAQIERVIARAHPEFLAYFRRCPVIIQADLGRMFLLERFGGVYCDVDFFPVQSPEGLLREFAPAGGDATHAFLIGEAQFPGWLNNAFLASTPRNPLWNEVVFPAALARLREFEQGEMARGAWRVEATAGPLFWQTEVRPAFYRLSVNARVVPYARVNGRALPGHKGPPTPAMERELLAQNALGYHWSEGSWLEGPEAVVTLFTDTLLGWVLLFIVVSALLAYGLYRLALRRVPEAPAVPAAL